MYFQEGEEMSRTTTGKSVQEVIRESLTEYLTGQGINTTSKARVFIRKEDAERMAEEYAEQVSEYLPRASGAKAWVGYQTDRSTVLFNGSSKGDIKSKWQHDIGADAKAVRTVYSGSGAYLYTYTAADFSTYSIWIVQAGMEGFGIAPET